MTSCVIMGSGDIGTDLMYKLLRSDELDLRALVGIDLNSEGLSGAANEGVEASSDGLAGVTENAEGTEPIFETTSDGIPRTQVPQYEQLGFTALNLTPAMVRRAVVPGVNLNEHVDAPECEPDRVRGSGNHTDCRSCNSYGKGSLCRDRLLKLCGARNESDHREFTRTTSACIEEVGGATTAKAKKILNPRGPFDHFAQHRVLRPSRRIRPERVSTATDCR